MKNYLKNNWLLIIICIVMASMLFAKCENEKVLSGNLDTLNIEMQSYKLKDGKIVNTSKTVTYEKIPEKTELTKKFAEVKTIIKIVEKVRIDTVMVAYKDTIPCKFDRTGSIVKKHYSLDYKSTQKGINVSNLQLSDTLEIVAGTKRKWFLGRETQTIDVSHSNPYITNKEIQHIEIKPKKKFYDTTLFKVGIGIIAGAIIIK